MSLRKPIRTLDLWQCVTHKREHKQSGHCRLLNLTLHCSMFSHDECCSTDTLILFHSQDYISSTYTIHQSSQTQVADGCLRQDTLIRSKPIPTALLSCVAIQVPTLTVCRTGGLPRTLCTFQRAASTALHISIPCLVYFPTPNSVFDLFALLFCDGYCKETQVVVTLRN